MILVKSGVFYDGKLEKLEAVAEVIEEPMEENTVRKRTNLDKLIDYFPYIISAVLLMAGYIIISVFVGHARAVDASSQICAPGIAASVKENLIFPYLWHGDVVVFCVADKNGGSVYVKAANF